MAGKQKPNLGRALSGVILAGILLSGCAAPPEIERNEQGDLIPYADLETARSFSWHQLEIVDDTHIRLLWGTSPTSKCWRHDVDVVETPKTVTLTLRGGSIPNAKKLCDDENPISQMSHSTESIIVKTESPIGNRQIIDGHTPG